MASDLFDITGKVAVVTGGSRGIGLMIARGFVDAGAKVYISSRRKDACDAAAADLSAAGGECVSAPADLSTEEGAASLASLVSDREARVDILVNNAGAAWGAPLEEYPDAAFDKVWAINVKAIFHLTKLLLPKLRVSASADHPARVINIGSIDGIRVPILENYAYSASKAAVHMLTRHLAKQLVTEHITVNAIAPGLFRSKMTEFMFSGEADPVDVGFAIPLGRAGRQEDIAGTVIYLASKAGSYLTGAVIAVDGGVSTL